MFKIRASSAGHIMAGKLGLTENQEKELITLQNKERTEKQNEKMEILIHKKYNLELGETVKTHCKNWFKSKVYNRKKELNNKYVDKGHITEDNSIDLIAEELDYGMLFKNEERKENDFMRGECDIVQPDHIIDVKNSWSWETFPLLETEIPNMDYYWQGQVYMDLWDRKHYKLIYVLSDTPIHLIEREAFYWCLNNGYDELQTKVLEEFTKRMTYSDIPNKDRIKVFEFDRNQDDINEIKERVELCREYIKQIEENYGSR